MIDSSSQTVENPAGQRLRGSLSLAALALAIAVVAGSFLLLSPPADQTYPGAIPWSPYSVLQRIVDVLSLGGLVGTARGVEIKELVLHIGACAALLILAARIWVSGRWPPARRTTKGAWFFGQAFLAAWVGVSLLSAGWSGEVSFSAGQAAIYGFWIAWAVSLGWSLEGRDVPRLVWGYLIVAVTAAILCVWYYYERNPFHRPGFPVGNPGALAAAILPALVIAAVVVLTWVVEQVRSGRRRPGAPGAAGMTIDEDRITNEVKTRLPSDVRYSSDPAPSTAHRAAAHGHSSFVIPHSSFVCAAVLALIPLAWCFWLAGSRAALVGIAFGAAALLFLRAGPRVRIAILFGAVLAAAAGAWVASAHNQDLAMARGATIRFRVYAWQYAAMLWSHRPVSGIGAGSYPRMATALSVDDRMLDPAAFMAELVEHAHNELFEVFAEIGLIGAVTFVAGWLATFAGAGRLLESSFSPGRRALMTGLVVGVAAIVGDGLFSVGPRLPGVAAVQFTLLGALWAMCRATSKTRAEGRMTNDEDQMPNEENVTRTSAVGHSSELPQNTAYSAEARGNSAFGIRHSAFVCAALLLAIAASWLTVRNWRGVLEEQAALENLAAHSYAEAAIVGERAAELLLDPVRRLVAQESAVRGRLAEAERRMWAWRSEMMREADGEPRPEDEPVAALRLEAIRAANNAYEAALRLNQRAPTFAHTAATGALAAEWLAELHRSEDERAALQWSMMAMQAWRSQRVQRPYDVQTLLALIRYPTTIGDAVGLLRDALRNGPMCDDWGEWQAALTATAQRPDFERTLDAMLQAERPFGPRTDLDTLMLRMTPEMHRLAAAWAAARGRYDVAEQHSERAAELYAAVRTRLPDRQAVALGEQATYALAHEPRRADRAVQLVERAIESLPRIQQQKAEEARRPFELRLARFLLAAGEQERGLALLRGLVETRPPSEWRVEEVVGHEVPEVNETGPRPVPPRDIRRASELAAAQLYLSLVQQFIRRPPESRPDVDRWLDAALRLNPQSTAAWAWRAWRAGESGDAHAVNSVLEAAAETGIGAEDIARIRRSVVQEFPALGITNNE